MGFGHRVYKSYDPRARIIKQTADEVFGVTGRNPLLDIALELERIALEDDYFVSRKLYPNVDFYSGLIYQAMGFPVEMFPVLFAIPRTAGWLAQWDELMRDSEQKIARPRQIYVGAATRNVEPVKDGHENPSHRRACAARGRTRVARGGSTRAARHAAVVHAQAAQPPSSRRLRRRAGLRAPEADGRDRPAPGRLGRHPPDARLHHPPVVRDRPHRAGAGVRGRDPIGPHRHGQPDRAGSRGDAPTACCSRATTTPNRCGVRCSSARTTAARARPSSSNWPACSRHGRSEFTYELVWLDGEEAFCRNWDECGKPGSPDNTYGSRYFVQAAKKANAVASIKAMVLLDMIGDRDLQIRRESNSTPWLTEIIWRAAKGLPTTASSATPRHPSKTTTWRSSPPASHLSI